MARAHRAREVAAAPDQSDRHQPIVAADERRGTEQGGRGSRQLATMHPQGTEWSPPTNNARHGGAGAHRERMLRAAARTSQGGAEARVEYPKPDPQGKDKYVQRKGGGQRTPLQREYRPRERYEFTYRLGETTSSPELRQSCRYYKWVRTPRAGGDPLQKSARSIIQPPPRSIPVKAARVREPP